MGYTMELLADLVTKPRQTLGRIKANGELKNAFYLMLVCQFLNNMVMSAEDISIFIKLAIFIIQLVFIVAAWLINCGMWHLLAKFLGGEGEYKNLLKLMAFCYFISVLTIPLYLLKLAMPELGFALIMLAGPVVVIWGIILNIMAISENYAISGLKATFVYLLPAMLFCFIVGVLIMLVIAAIGIDLNSVTDMEQIIDNAVQL